MSESFPPADIWFSEILLIGRENHQSSKNKTVIDINARVRDYCQETCYVYVKHSKLQLPAARSLFDDGVHISNSEGTAVLASDIQRTLRDRRPPAQDTQPGSTMVFYNSKCVDPKAGDRTIKMLPGKTASIKIWIWTIWSNFSLLICSVIWVLSSNLTVYFPCVLLINTMLYYARSGAWRGEVIRAAALRRRL